MQTHFFNGLFADLLQVLRLTYTCITKPDEGRIYQNDFTVLCKSGIMLYNCNCGVDYSVFNFRGKVAVSEIRKKISDSNPHVAKNALIVCE